MQDIKLQKEDVPQSAENGYYSEAELEAIHDSISVKVDAVLREAELGSKALGVVLTREEIRYIDKLLWVHPQGV